MSNQQVTRLLGLACLALWIGSLFLPAVVLGPQRGGAMVGSMILMLGWMGPLAWQFGWFGNISLILLLVRMISRLGPGWSDVLLASACLLFAVDAVFWREMYFDDGSSPILALGAGYYLWFAAILVASLWTLRRWFNFRRIANQDKSF